MIIEIVRPVTQMVTPSARRSPKAANMPKKTTNDSNAKAIEPSERFRDLVFKVFLLNKGESFSHNGQGTGDDDGIQFFVGSDFTGFLNCFGYAT